MEFSSLVLSKRMIGLILLNHFVIQIIPCGPELLTCFPFVTLLTQGFRQAIVVCVWGGGVNRFSPPPPYGGSGGVSLTTRGREVEVTKNTHFFVQFYFSYFKAYWRPYNEILIYNCCLPRFSAGKKWNSQSLEKIAVHFIFDEATTISAKNSGDLMKRASLTFINRPLFE